MPPETDSTGEVPESDAKARTASTGDLDSKQENNAINAAPTLQATTSVHVDKTLSATVENQLQKQCSTASSLSVSVIEEAAVEQEQTNAPRKSVAAKPAWQFGQAAPTTANSNANKKPLDVFNEYVKFFFQKAEVYEKELERRESHNDLQTSLDHVRHGNAESQNHGSDVNLVQEEDVKMNDDESNTTDSSPRLSPTTEAIAVVEAMANFRSLSKVKREVSFRSEHDDETQVSRKRKSIQITQGGADAMIEDEQGVQEKWEKFCTTKKQNVYEEVAIENISLSMTVDEFYTLVLKDGASDSIGNFMTENGDIDVDTTSWEPADGQPGTRTIHYTHPVNVPMAPPTAKAFKTQYLHKFHPFGLCLESSTIVEDVPMTDCFVVDDRLWVCQNAEGGCTVKVTFQIRFVKTTMFRRIIENATRTEFQKWWTQFGHMVAALKEPPSIAAHGEEEEDFELVAKELEEVAQLIEEECIGHEVPLDALKKIQSSSRRLSMVAKRSSMRSVSKSAPKAGISLEGNATKAYQSLVSFLGRPILFLKDGGLSENIIPGLSILLFFMCMFNMWTYQQLLVTNRALLDLDAQLKQLSTLLMESPSTC